MATDESSFEPDPTTGEQPADAGHRSGLTRRSLLAGLGVTSAAGAAAVFTGCSAGDDKPTVSTSGGNSGEVHTVAFDGTHQAGIATSHQPHAILVAYDVIAKKNKASSGSGDSGDSGDSSVSSGSTDSNGSSASSGKNIRQTLQRVMRIWTPDARRLTQGETALADLESELNSSPGNLTITVGWAPQIIIDANLQHKTPQWIQKNQRGLPPFKGDKLDPKYSDGDIILQFCGDDLTALAHAARVMTRSVSGILKPRWTQRGFVNAQHGETPRNLLGFKDGTAIPRTEEEYDEAVWDNQGGSAMVVRRVTYKMQNWEALDRNGREIVFGRTIVEGGPLSGGGEFDEPDLNAIDEFGIPKIDPNSHVGLMAGSGKHMLRRPYNWDNEINEHGDTGLIFICFQDDPDRAFTPLQKMLAERDRLNEWIVHTGSALFWVPPGTQEGTYWGQSLLEG